MTNMQRRIYFILSQKYKCKKVAWETIKTNPKMRYKLEYELFQLENKNGIITEKVLKREQPVSKSKRCGKIFDTRVQSESRNELWICLL